MAPQTEIPVAATVLGTIGTVFWCIQLVPQIWYNWKQKKTDGLPGIMMFLWAISAVPFGDYAIIQKFNLPIQIQPQIFCALCLVTWAQILHYNTGYTAIHASLIAIGVGIMFASVEVLLILTIRPVYDRGVEWPVMVIGVVAAILLGAGLLPPYAELWKRGGRVVGIHFGFLTVDWLGAFFSLMGVITQKTFDPLGGCLFIVCIVIEGGIFLSHALWLFRTRKIRAAAKAAGKAFDDLPESEPYHVDIPRRGSIAVSRDIEHIEIERRGSVTLLSQRDLEAGLARKRSVIESAIEEVDSMRSGVGGKGTVVREEEVRRSLEGEGVGEVDYGTMSGKGKGEGEAGGRKRPGFERQDTGASFFPGKDPEWGVR